ncbi:MAG: hypothetical protein HYW80_01550 [Parcubacteria group bacterium]|nr:hypothetical protein [Parcubacteria group bacterium]
MRWIKENLLWLAIIAIGTALILVFVVRKSDEVSPETFALAQCLTEQSVKMYGADWCSACQKQKALFGDAFREINYVECDEEPIRCTQERIEKFPTWIFPDGAKIEGVLSLEKLSQIAGCNLTP